MSDLKEELLALFAQSPKPPPLYAGHARIVQRHERKERLKWVEYEDGEDDFVEVSYCVTCTMGNSCGCCVTSDEDWVAWPCPTLLDIAALHGMAEVPS